MNPRSGEPPWHLSGREIAIITAFWTSLAALTVLNRLYDPRSEGLRVEGKTFAVRERMQALEEKLDPRRFFRIHRSAIVRLDAIDVFLRHAGGDYGVRLKSGVQLSVSRTRREELEARLGIA